jgi:hypothetical protein
MRRSASHSRGALPIRDLKNVENALDVNPRTRAVSATEIPCTSAHIAAPTCTSRRHRPTLTPSSLVKIRLKVRQLTPARLAASSSAISLVGCMSSSSHSAATRLPDDGMRTAKCPAISGSARSSSASRATTAAYERSIIDRCVAENIAINTSEQFRTRAAGTKSALRPVSIRSAQISASYTAETLCVTDGGSQMPLPCVTQYARRPAVIHTPPCRT